MRIRKRQIPLPLSSLSPIPLSDLQVQLHPHIPFPPDKSPPPSDSHQSQYPIDAQGTPTNDAAAIDHCSKLLVDEEGLIEKKIGNDSSDLAMGGLLGGSAPNSSSHQVGRSYHDGERAFPLKKRSGSFQMDKEKNKKGKIMRSKSLKTKVKKKCNSEDDEYEEMIIKKDDNSKRRGNRGNVLMEGSRCSRVNGRGWRCCQPTLIGYSLCEHHLGKGRLRSIMNVKSRHTKINKTLPSSSSQAAKLELIDEADDDDEDDDDDNDVEKMMLIMTGAKKVMKMGVVKARSMSSLLSQADNSGGASRVIAAESSDGKENTG